MEGNFFVPVSQKCTYSVIQIIHPFQYIVYLLLSVLRAQFIRLTPFPPPLSYTPSRPLLSPFPHPSPTPPSSSPTPLPPPLSYTPLVLSYTPSPHETSVSIKLPNYTNPASGPTRVELSSSCLNISSQLLLVWDLIESLSVSLEWFFIWIRLLEIHFG